MDDLISEHLIPNWECALGLYVVGRPDAELRQLENAIVAERRTHQLRIISTEYLLSLAEMRSEYGVSHEEILTVLRPSGPRIDPIVDLMARLVAERRSEKLTETTTLSVTQNGPLKEPVPMEATTEENVVYWLTSVRSDEKGTAENTIQNLVGKEHAYAFADSTPGRKVIKPGDWICFYANGKGIIAHAKVVSYPEQKTIRSLRHPEKYPWSFRLDNTALYTDKPVVISAELRSNLDAFQGRDPTTPWAWFVQATHKLNQHDFNLLTRQ